MKKQIMAVSAFCILTFNSIVFAAGDVNAEQAFEIAAKYVPVGIAHVTTEYDAHKQNPYYEVKFYDNDTNTEYEVEIYRNGGVRKFHMDMKNASGSSKIVLSSLAVQKIIKQEYPEAVFKKMDLIEEKGLYVYKTKFHNKEVKCSMTVNPESGLIMEKEIEYISNTPK
ncbi:MAG: PepSY domain-containing protein [Phascolarctobacterium sp.]|nr:PepSY domain-containing protein [Phascolarctobacterium sp.]